MCRSLKSNLIHHNIICLVIMMYLPVPANDQTIVVPLLDESLELFMVSLCLTDDEINTNSFHMHISDNVWLHCYYVTEIVI